MTNNEAIHQERFNQVLKIIPPRFQEIKLNTDLLEKVKNKGVILTGGVGSGKTHKLIEVIITYMIEKYSKPFPIEITQEMFRKEFQSVPNTLRLIKDEFDVKGPASIVESMINKEILFLDDLGAEKASDWVKEQLYIVINERYNWKRPVMITTNLKMKEIASNYGDRFVSRLIEMCEVIKIESEDRRMQSVIR